MKNALAIGIDLGTSGARAVVMAEGFEVIAQAAAPLARFGTDGRAPEIWWAAVEAVLLDVLAQVDRSRIRALAVDGTSGTVLAVDAAGRPLATPLMYNDKVEDQALLVRIAGLIAPSSAAHGPTSGLAKALAFQPIPGIARTLHQADWIAGRLTGRFDVTDENNALKTGYDPVSGIWPDWIQDTGLRAELLPRVIQPGDPIGGLQPEIARHLGLSPEVMVVAGTTDGCASFLATGADLPGDAVSALGSTLTLKLLSDKPIFAPEYGIYSHHIAGMWLAGGASNAGGRVLAQYFSSAEIERLSAQIDTRSETGLDYYPLLGPGERFPIQDASHPPRLTPKPPDDATFLKAMFEGMAAIEQLGYQRLAELGAPPLRSLRSVGGGAGNPQWTAIRQRKLGVPFLAAQSDEAAAGTARLALAGARNAGLI